MSLLEQVKPAGAPGVKEVQLAKHQEDNKIVTNDKISNKSIFDGYLVSVGNSAGVDKVQESYKAAQTQYTLADMKLFHHDDNSTFNAIMASGMLMA